MTLPTAHQARHRARFTAAIIGTGRIGSLLERDPLRHKPHTHAGWYAAHPQVTLVAGADVDASRLREFGEDWHIPAAHLYADYRELLARERPDLVSICAYAPQRLEMARAAIDAGARGLWLEKAVGCSMAEASALRALAADARVPVVVNHMRRADPAWRRTAALVADGTLGRLESVHCLFSGHFVHTGTHAWDLLDEWCGPWASLRCWPEPPAARAASLDGQEGQVSEESGWAAVPHGLREAVQSDPGGVAHIHFESGVHAFVSGSPKRYFVFQCDLVFTAGRIEMGNDVRRVWRPAPSPRYEGFVELAVDADPPGLGAEEPSMLETLVRAVAAGEPERDQLDSAIRALNLGLAVVRASQAPGVSITPADVDPGFYVASV